MMDIHDAIMFYIVTKFTSFEEITGHEKEDKEDNCDHRLGRSDQFKFCRPGQSGEKGTDKKG